MLIADLCDLRGQKPETMNESAIENHNSQIENHILSLDPSSTVVGYANIGFDGRLLEGGLITPDVPSAGSYERTVSLCEQLPSLLDTLGPGTILTEWTVGKVGQRRHSGGGAGLPVYGCGVGSIATECRHWAKSQPAAVEVIAINENDWTRGVKKKDRQYAVAQEYAAYRIADDPKGDVSDAIGMALWWLKERALLWNR